MSDAADPPDPPDEPDPAVVILEDGEVVEAALRIMHDFAGVLAGAPDVETHDRVAAANLVGSGAVFFYCLAAWLEGVQELGVRERLSRSIVELAREHAEKLVERAKGEEVL